MEACLETASPAVNTGIRAWVMDASEARTAGQGDGMVGELRGVPKPALQSVFGKALGRRVWDYTRRLSERGAKSRPASDGDAAVETTGSVVSDAEIVGGMIEYVSKRAGETLRESGRQAKAIGLRLAYVDGVETLERMRLARPTNDGGELLAAAMDLFRRVEARGVVVESVDLRVTSVLTEPVSEPVGGLDYGMASMVGAVGARA